MSTLNSCFSLVLFISLTVVPSRSISDSSSSPYLSPNTIFQNYQHMLDSFKIFVYPPEKSFAFSTPHESLFYSSLLNSSFLTPDPNRAHLFLVPFGPDLSTRSISRVVRTLRTELPFWNRTLGADHVYVSCRGIGYESDRNLVELKKNSVQISCFPTRQGHFVPHKDITLPPLPTPRATHAPTNMTRKYLGYYYYDRNRVGVEESTLVNELKLDADFLVESGPSDGESMAGSDFCLFEYGRAGGGDVSLIGDAMRLGCVPVIVTDRPIQDLPFMDVLSWRDLVVIVGGGPGEVRRVLSGDARGRVRRGLGLVGRHFVWNEAPQPYDAFHTVMYQLWLRRHVIRYARRE